MRVRRVRELAVRSQCVERYVAVHEAMERAVATVLPVVAVHSIDELSAQLTPGEDAQRTIPAVKAAVAGALSRYVPVSVAVAPRAWLAKTAAEALPVSGGGFAAALPV